MKIETLIVSVLLAGCLLWGLFAIISTFNFCKRYFPNVPALECVMSDRYRYDGDR
jgi:hypothetical protein